ncbi:HNH endonuclease [Escherichia coli]|uniref:HNH endonuclease n=1 Tax=Escherichia coli TaxID=562 RepID=UPI00200DA30D|nr:HNH endonuclease [Escherichia coli]
MNTITVPVSAIEDSGYEIRRDGAIYSLKSRRVLRGFIKDGYIRYSICINGGVMDLSGHRMVAAKYLGNPLNFPEVNHKDSNKRNNSVENLEWVSPQQNSFHSHHGSHEHLQSAISQARKLCEKGIGQIEIARSLGISQGSVSHWTKGLGKTKPRYSNETKIRAIEMRAAGVSAKKISMALNVGMTSVLRWTGNPSQ